MSDSEFFDVTDAFIDLANNLNDKCSTTRISSAIMYAAARYNAHNYFATDGDKETEQKAIEYYCDQYKKMLEENMKSLRDELQKEDNEKT